MGLFDNAGASSSWLDMLARNPRGWGNLPPEPEQPKPQAIFDEYGQPHDANTGRPLYQNNEPQKSASDSLHDIAMSPVNMAMAPVHALTSLSELGGFPNPQDPQNQQDVSALVASLFGGNTMRPAAAGEAGAMRALSDTGKPSLLGSALAGAESKPIRAYHGSRSPNEIVKFDADQTMNIGPHFGPLETAELFAGTHPWQWQPGQDLAGPSPGAFAAEAISKEKPGLLSRLGFGNDRVQQTQDRQIQKIQTHDAATLSEMANSPEGGRILPVDLDFKNPLHVPDLVDKAHGLWLPSEIAKTLQEHGVSFHSDDWNVFNAGDNARPVAPMGDSGSVMSRNKFGANTAENAAANALIRKRLGDAGYDGIKYADGDTGAGHSYIATSPGTVRSATTGETLFSDTGKPSPLGAALAGAEEQKGITAYHGSPHDFDKFDLSKIGTGEGSQKYGHGIYFAENEAVAQSYSDTLAPLHNQRPFTVNVPGNPFDGTEMLEPDMTAKGHMYQVRLNADPEHFLDWDKPLSGQSEAVKTKLGASQNPADIAEAEALAKQLRIENYHMDHTGGARADAAMKRAAEIRDRLEALDKNSAAWWKNDAMDSAARPEAAAKLKELGIPGIRYLDGGSRKAGEGSHNYVVFSPEIIELLKKYGIAGPMLGQGVGQLIGGRDDKN